jgi:hypothetical protein
MTDVNIQKKTLMSYVGTSAKSLKKRVVKRESDITLGRIGACFPDFASYFLLMMKVTKKVDCDVPPCFQFGSMISLPWDYSDEKTAKKVEGFMVLFTQLINGKRSQVIEEAIKRNTCKLHKSITFHATLVQVAENAEMVLEYIDD